MRSRPQARSKERSQRMNFDARREALSPFLKDLQADCLLVTSLPNIRYLTGFTGSNAVALVSAKGEAHLLTDPRYTLRAAQESDARVHIVRGSLAEAAAKLVTKKRWKSLAFEASRITVSNLTEFQQKLTSSVRLHATSGLVERLRMVKDADEIAIIRQSVHVNSEAFRRATAKLKPSVTENTIAAMIEFEMRKLGAEKPSFETIVASGPHAALPHAQPRAETIGVDQLLLIDMGAYVGGYASDMTRMMHLGSPSRKSKKLYAAVLEAQLAAVDAVRPGVTAGAIDKVTRRVMRQHGLEEAFVHSTGHGVGLEIHEGPRLGRKDGTVLEAGMVITIEPGAYLDGFGGVRIEDMLLVTATGAEVLTPTSKELFLF
jgi:Xaa-Pro aminopeptidase